jgi:ABC-2 type transport system permease protein
MQGAAFLVLTGIGAITVKAGPQLLIAFVAAVLFVAANAGIGTAGASLFFLLEVKQGVEPITWSYRYLVQIVTGLYIPLAILPVWVRAIGVVLPQTHAFAIERAVLLTGAGLDSRLVVTSLVALTAITVVVVTSGCLMLRAALDRAERQGGIGVVV